MVSRFILSLSLAALVSAPAAMAQNKVMQSDTKQGPSVVQGDVKQAPAPVKQAPVDVKQAPAIVKQAPIVKQESVKQAPIVKQESVKQAPAPLVKQGVSQK